ncbi:hypothetical protein ACFORO_01690 [Amycolatopsis halotolerans]|uniref:Uncharacterized protein n=1 Tax=Amycolatopsis halotolerans TaxID=330083 RepID=A0ABV7Q9E6_9PSEU
MRNRRRTGRAPSAAEIRRVVHLIALRRDACRVSREQIAWPRWENHHAKAVFLPPGLPRNSVWNIKKFLLRGLCDAPSLAPFEDELADLVAGAVHRRQEAYDRYYSRLALRLDCPWLRSALAEAALSESAETRVRAAWMLNVLDHPETPPTQANWRAWTAAQGLRHAIDRAAHVEDNRDQVHARRHEAVAARRKQAAVAGNRARRPRGTPPTRHPA